ncbi:GDSL esterase/lipase At1g74460 [Linum grandiflorum]
MAVEMIRARWMLNELSGDAACAADERGEKFLHILDKLFVDGVEERRVAESDNWCCYRIQQLGIAVLCDGEDKAGADVHSKSKYVFWDEYHPSDSANQLIAAKELINKFGFLSTSSPPPSSAPPFSAPSHAF